MGLPIRSFYFVLYALMATILGGGRWLVKEADAVPPATGGVVHRWAVRIGRRFDEKVQGRARNFSSAVAGARTAPPPSSSATSLISAAAESTTSTARGGASAAVKTMTARQFEAFNLFSGGVAGTVASCLTNPLEVIKTQLQSSSTAGQGGLAAGRGHPVTVAKSILQRDGPAGFFRGLPPTLIGIIPSRSAYFYAYQRCKEGLSPWLPAGSPPNAMLSGLLAGIAGNTLTNPIWMVRTRMQLLADTSAGQRAYSGYRDAIATIFQEEGLPGFYKGIWASYWGCAEGAVQFILYEQFKSRLIARHNKKRESLGLPPSDQLTKLEYFLSAAAAKTCASVATYPHEVARTRLREQARSGLFKYHGMWQTLAVIAKEEGRGGLYAGMGVHLMKVVPNSAFMFLTYEIVRGWLSQYTIVDDRGKVVAATRRRTTWEAAAEDRVRQPGESQKQYGQWPSLPGAAYAAA